MIDKLNVNGQVGCYGTISGATNFGIDLASGKEFSVTNTHANWQIKQYGEPQLIDTIVKDDSIELVYTETKLWSMSFGDVEKRVFKIIYSCKEGKWNKSDKIYGEIIPASEERYEFE